MNIAMLLEMAADGLGDRVAYGSKHGSGLTYAAMLDQSKRAATVFAAHGGQNIGMIDLNSPAVPVAIYGAAQSGKPFIPLNYRLTDEQLKAILARSAPALFVVDDSVVERVQGVDGIDLITREQFMKQVAKAEPIAESLSEGDEDIAVLLFTSGTTGEPKAAVLRHRHLVSYVISSVEFMAAAEEDAILVSVPPYHIASISGFMTHVYAGRRVVALSAFTPEDWVNTARDEDITNAMVVPTMLGRILDVLDKTGDTLPSLRALSYGGGKMLTPVIERALEMLPHVEFVNAYGLTETSSTIALLGPDDHRVAFYSDDPKMRARLGSVGQPLPSIELEIRDPYGKPVPQGESGEVWVRGEQVSGEYLGRSGGVDDGWFPTRDGGHLDEDGYLFLEGRLDDVIVRGGENMSPGEIEEVLVNHPAVEEACVVGIPDQEWGERVVAAVVLTEGASASVEELQTWVKDRLRSTRVPTMIDFRAELPYNDTGKLLRRVVKAELADPTPA
jgi:acyl-CoA synthetase (AMP-forming)/AMP-acid ligase II